MQSASRQSKDLINCIELSFYGFKRNIFVSCPVIMTSAENYVLDRKMTEKQRRR